MDQEPLQTWREICAVWQGQRVQPQLQLRPPRDRGVRPQRPAHRRGTARRLQHHREDERPRPRHTHHRQAAETDFATSIRIKQQ